MERNIDNLLVGQSYLVKADFKQKAVGVCQMGKEWLSSLSGASVPEATGGVCGHNMWETEANGTWTTCKVFGLGRWVGVRRAWWLELWVNARSECWFHSLLIAKLEWLLNLSKLQLLHCRIGSSLPSSLGPGEDFIK